jgi:glycosyltransferase involved in cell wall biosynthesis
MTPISVVIIAKNEAEGIANCISRAMLITDDIVVIDNGSTDATVSIAEAYGCNVQHSTRQSYGANKNKGIALARYNWILSLDADELPDTELIDAIRHVNLKDVGVAYDIRFKSYLGQKQIRFGSWGRDHHVRLFNRRLVKWSEPQVHETLIMPKQMAKQRLKGYMHHYSAKDAVECMDKAIFYAKLSAQKYFKTGKKVSFVGLYLSPAFSFLMSYIVFMGFLDGKEGLQVSRSIMKNKQLKYQLLDQMEQVYGSNQFVRSNFTVEY